jgi:cephalosporin hydroxylase
MGTPQFTHKRIQWIKGSSTDPKIVKQVKALIKPTDRVMLALDSDHTAEHVLKELKLYGPLVTSGCYCVVDDTNLGGHPIMNAAVPGPGPYAAVQEYVAQEKSFTIDQSRHKFWMTWSPNGFLLKR